MDHPDTRKAYELMALVDEWIKDFPHPESDKFNRGLDEILRVIAMNVNNTKDVHAVMRKAWITAMLRLLVDVKSAPLKLKILKKIQNKIRAQYVKNELHKFFDTAIYRRSFQSRLKRKLQNVGKILKNEPVPWNVFFYQILQDINNQGSYQVQQQGDFDVKAKRKSTSALPLPAQAASKIHRKISSGNSTILQNRNRRSSRSSTSSTLPW